MQLRLQGFLTVESWEELRSSQPNPKKKLAKDGEEGDPVPIACEECGTQLQRAKQESCPEEKVKLSCPGCSAAYTVCR